MKKSTTAPAATPAPTTATSKNKPGRPSHLTKTDDPALTAEWAHLRAWWKEYGDLYNVKSIGKRTGIDNITVGYLLKGPETDSEKIKMNTKANTPRSYAATRERLDVLKKILALHYQEGSFSE